MKWKEAQKWKYRLGWAGIRTKETFNGSTLTLTFSKWFCHTPTKAPSPPLKTSKTKCFSHLCSGFLDIFKKKNGVGNSVYISSIAGL